MILDVTATLFLGPFCAALHWLLARSVIFEWFWSRVTGWAANLLACPACSGFWLGIGFAAAGMRPIVGMSWWLEIATGGLLGVYLTPIFEGFLMWGLTRSALPVAHEDRLPESLAPHAEEP